MKDINDFYFTKEDYETFSNENATKNTKDIREARKRVKEKLLEINQDLYPKILTNNLNLATHKSSEHLTSLDYPCSFNKYRVDWLGIRYGRNASDIAELSEILNTFTSSRERTSEDKKLGFQKYACLQVNVCGSGMEVGIFHSVPFDAVDRMYMEEVMKFNTQVQEKIITELKKLKGYGYVWSISNGVEEPKYFNIDDQRAEDFISWYNVNDKVGCWSSMLKHFPMYDDKIFSKENIIETSYDIIEQLKPLYELVIWKRNKNNL